MTRDEAIQAAGETYGAILADPERRERLRRDLAALEATQTSARPASPAPAERRKKSA